MISSSRKSLLALATLATIVTAGFAAPAAYLLALALERLGGGQGPSPALLRAAGQTLTVSALATAAERARIARDMHDVVAHSLAVIVAQADGGRYAAASDPQAAVAALATISTTARVALADVRHGFLRFFLTMIGVGFLVMAAPGWRRWAMPCPAPSWRSACCFP